MRPASIAITENSSNMNEGLQANNLTGGMTAKKFIIFTEMHFYCSNVCGILKLQILPDQLLR